MGKILDKILGRRGGRGAQESVAYGALPVGSRPYVPAAVDADMYQQVLVRAVVERFALACSKLKPEIKGDARPSVVRAFETHPNSFQTWPQFLARCATIWLNRTSCVIVPEMDGDVQVGFWPVSFSTCAVVEDHAGDYWLRWTSRDGDARAVELDRAAIVTRFQYRSDWFGDGNILDGTLATLHAQERAQVQAINDSAQVRFIGAFNGNVREEDQADKRDRFAEQNLSSANRTSLMTYDNTFRDLKQLEAQNWTLPTEEMERIENSVFDYFGVSRKILQNTYDENVWDAYYEGLVEPFALALGEAMTKATFIRDEIPDNLIMFTANRLEYSSAASKRNMGKDMGDRAAMKVNEIREMLQLPPVPGGDVFILRGEYKVGHTLEEIFQAQQAQAQAQASPSGGENELSDTDGKDADGERADGEGYGSPGDTDSGDATTTTQDRFEE